MAASDNFIPALNKDNVFIKNESDLRRKITKIASDGVAKLQIVTDFDFTLTRHVKDDGTPVPTTYDMFTNCRSIPEHYKLENPRLANIYRKYEIDGTLGVQEKTEKMVEWYTKVNEALLGVQMPRQELIDEARTVIPWLRTGVKNMINWTEKNKVPLLIFSAGMGECVRAIMETSNLMPQNVKLISNFCKLDDKGIITGIEGEIIHPVNKNETAIKNTEYYEMVKDRSNVIVMGDALGDAAMADGMEHCDEILKIGFLGRDVEKNREPYRKTFDIVLERDNTMDVPLAILRFIASQQKSKS